MESTERSLKVSPQSKILAEVGSVTELEKFKIKSENMSQILFQGKLSNFSFFPTALFNNTSPYLSPIAILYIAVSVKCCILVCSTFHGFFLKLNSLRSRAGQFRRKSNENEITCHMCHMIDHMINVINMPERIIEKLKLTCNLKNLPGVPFYNCTRV